jgi:GT2 family glycosyltransferase
MKDFRVYYGIPTYTQFNRAKQAIEHIMETSSLIPDQIVVIDNSGSGAALPVIQPVLERYTSVQLIPRETNILSGAWNDLMNLFPDDYIIIANDDVKPHKHSIEALVTAARTTPEVAMFNGSGHSGNSYSFFLLRKWAYTRVGPFDEKFRPAYFEDNDYDYRLRILAGLIRQEVSAATFDHVGSATMKAMTPEQLAKHHMLFARSERYYMDKWGNTPGKERFTEPFQDIYKFLDD